MVPIAGNLDVEGCQRGIKDWNMRTLITRKSPAMFLQQVHLHFLQLQEPISYVHVYYTSVQKNLQIYFQIHTNHQDVCVYL